jgi:predicted outer membrane repeat protein
MREITLFLPTDRSWENVRFFTGRTVAVVLTLVLLNVCVTIRTLFAAPHLPADAAVTDCTNDTQLRNGVQAGGLITFNCGAGSHTIPMTSYIEVSGAVTIDGGGVITLDGANTFAFFQVFNSGSLTLRNLTLRRGQLNGANPLENFGALTLENVIVADHTSTATAGALVNYGQLVVRNSTFRNNSAGNPGGASGAAILNDGGIITVESSSFISNTITSNTGSGGAISNRSGDLTVIGSTFRGNGALDGGALYVNSGTVVTVTHSLFEGNQAGYGGAIESRGQLDVNDSVLRNNRATSGDGGAIWVLDGDLDLAYTTISGNQATTTGGGISCYGNTLSVIHSTLSGNGAGGNGGAIYSTCNLNLTNSTLSGNRATGSGSGGGGVYQAGSGTATVAAVTVVNNTASFGAGVYNDGGGGSALTLQYTLLANNATGNCDGVITSFGYNLSSDSNCSALTQTGDGQNVALPLGPLANNGGPTLTHLPVAGNPAIDAIPAAQCGFSNDQRGLARPVNGQCDIGAVETGNLYAAAWLPLVRN